ncbi:hypothetical protein G7Y79_00015g039270 [Physcia stellaris]|nr:hypothetical protein G7Y79_00015g039270 [Physcia stellaris]
MAVEVTLNSPLAEALSNVVQPKLSEVGWSTGGLDDSALTEYIILMLVNGKTQEQIAAELSNDLLNLEPDDSGAIEFAAWLFNQVEELHVQINGGPTSQTQSGQQEYSERAQYDAARLARQNRKLSNGSADSPDTEMGEAVPNSQDGAIPTGPKSMRNGSRNGSHNSRRLIGQLSKAMDRSSDAVLHRVRPQQGTERINMHNRQPPKGPRIDQARNLRPVPNGRPAMPNTRIPNGGSGSAIPNMTPQQQMQLFAMYEEQARMMSQIFSPTHQQMLMPGMPQPAINPAFRNGINQQNPAAGRSLFERVEANPQRQNGQFRRQNQINGGSSFSSNHSNAAQASDDQQGFNGDISSSMEVESSQTNPNESSPDTTCRYNLTCTKKDCPFSHQSPAAPPGTTIDVNDPCPFGAACRNRKCVGRHPSPAQKASHQSEQDCKFFPSCTNASCPFRHPTMPMCRNGADCTREGCKFTHVNITCRYNPCLNAACPYKHAEGQKRGVFDDKVWVADGGRERGHVSERKFVDNEEEGEELIVPDHQGQGSQEIVT